jgi:hypothetical protein
MQLLWKFTTFVLNVAKRIIAFHFSYIYCLIKTENYKYYILDPGSVSDLK